MKEKVIRNVAGTHEWATDSLNFISGCGNGCLYCYSREMADRYKQKKASEWSNETVREHDLKKTIRKYEKRVMFPSSHDIRPEHLEQAVIFLRKILMAGNEVLLVSKPHLKCIKRICDEFSDYKEKILFRFTIGSASDKVLKFWEPNAPDFSERHTCLEFAFRQGFQTSVSCEPMLDNHIERVVNKAEPFVTETIWLGKINRLLGKTGKGRLEFNGELNEDTRKKAEELNAWQNDANMIKLFKKYQSNPKIRWKESIKHVLRKNEII